jgi:hypothetical protein
MNAPRKSNPAFRWIGQLLFPGAPAWTQQKNLRLLGFTLSAAILFCAVFFCILLVLNKQGRI